MNATARTTDGPPPCDPGPTLRDEIAQTHPPANAYERMLLAQLTQAWERLERAYAAERTWAQGRDLSEIIRTRLDEFKAVTRYVTDCERAWRHAAVNLEKAQRRRQREAKSSPEARRPATSASASVSRPPAPPPFAKPAAAPFAPPIPPAPAPRAVQVHAAPRE